MRTEVHSQGGIPILFADGAPFTLRIWTAGLRVANQTDEQIEAEMEWAAVSGFNAVEIVAEWRMVEARRDLFDWSRIDRLMGRASSLGLCVLLTVDAGWAPPWFADEAQPEAVFVTMDPNPEDHPGMVSGRLATPGFTSLPIFYHPGYWQEADEYVVAAVERYRVHPALFGYSLYVFTTGEYNYPGGTAYGIAGFADYSGYTIGLFGQPPPSPLPEFSQVTPDTRPEWLAWSDFRIEKKREALDHFGTLVKSVDPDHVLVSWLGCSPMWGAWDNGLIAEASGGDYSYQLTRPYLDVLRAAPQLTPNLFETVDGELSLLSQMLLPAVAVTQKSGKVFLLQSERAMNEDAPDLTGVITSWARAFAPLGVHVLWWKEPEGYGVSGQWTEQERREIVTTLSLFTGSPESLPRSDFAFLDLPSVGGKYYADSTFTWLFGMRVGQAFLDAGLPFDTVSSEAVMADPTILEQYQAVGLPVPQGYDLLAPDELKAVLAAYESSGRTVWRGSPADARYYYLSGYADTGFLDTLRAFFDVHGLARHHYDGHGLQIWGSRPYLFLLARLADYVGTVEASLIDWELADGPVTLREAGTGKIVEGVAKGGVLSIDVALDRGQPHLLVLQ